MEQSTEEVRFMLGEQLKNRRKELGITQEELAQRLGMLQPHVARMETIGPRTVDALLQWCVALDMRLVLEKSKTMELVDKAMEDPRVIDELVDSPPDDILQFEDIPVHTGLKPPLTKKNKDMEFCKHGAVKGLCKKGCK